MKHAVTELRTVYWTYYTFPDVMAHFPMSRHVTDVMPHMRCYGTYFMLWHIFGRRTREWNMCHNTECKDMSILRVMAQMTCYGTYLSCYGTNDKKYVPQRTLQWVMAQMSCRNHSVSACIQYNVIIDLNAWIYKYARKCQSLRVVAAPATNRCGWIYGYMRAPAMKILCLLPVYRRAYTPINTRIRLHISLCRPV